jgi:hypothetical protein
LAVIISVEKKQLFDGKKRKGIEKQDGRLWAFIMKKRLALGMLLTAILRCIKEKGLVCERKTLSLGI